MKTFFLSIKISGLFLRTAQTALILGASLLISAAAYSGETIIFADDFESYTAGSDLDGQGGWVRIQGTNHYPVEQGPLGSQSARGPLVVGRNPEQNLLNHSLVWDGTGRIKLSLDAYASSNPRVSHNSGVLLKHADMPRLYGWVTNIFAPNGWVFRPGPNPVEFVGNIGLGEPVSLEVVIDGENQEVFGRADFGSGGIVDTQRYPLNGVDLTLINSIEIAQDYRSVRKGVDFDNIVVTYTPPILDISIDVKPGRYPNNINLNSCRATRVALLGSAEFDVNDIDPETLTLGTAGIKTVGKRNHRFCRIDDVSGDFSLSLEGDPDGYQDLVCHFTTMGLAPEDGDTEATLNGELFNGTSITGTDSVNIIPLRNRYKRIPRRYRHYGRYGRYRCKNLHF